MFFPKATPLFITILLLPQVLVQGGIMRELHRKFLGFFKSTKSKRPGPFYGNCNLCTFSPCTPIVWSNKNDNYDGSVDAEKIWNAISARLLTASHKATVANILIDRSALQRTAIAESFTKKYNMEIKAKLLERMNNPFFRYFRFIRSLSWPLPRFISEQFQLVMTFQTYGDRKKDGQALIVEMFTTLPKCLLEKAIDVYHSEPNKNLISDLDKALEKGGMPLECREVVKKLAELKRDTNQHASWIKALIDAYKLRSAVNSRQETRIKEIFSELFIERSVPQIIETMVVYDNLRNGEKEYKSFNDDFDKYTGGEKEVYKIMVSLFTNKPLYYAKVIERILKNVKEDTTYEERFVYMIAGRFDIDLKDIIDAYNQQSEKGFKADFDDWDKGTWAEAFHPIILDILAKVSRMP